MDNDHWIADTVGAICDPIIVMPGGWGDSLPEWIKSTITLERLLENMAAITKGREPIATDAEATAYLYTASLTDSMSHDWAQIYLYVAGQTMRKSQKIELPCDIRVESISDHQMHKLNELKRWIYETRVKARKHKQSNLKQCNVKQSNVESSAQEPILQPRMFNLEGG